MDIISLFGNAIPAYFVIGPLIIIAIIIVVLMMKSSKASGPTVATPTPQPIAEAVPVTTPIKEDVQAVPKATEVIAPTAPLTTPPAPPAPAQPAVQETAATPPVEASIPPLSSWKPSAPAPVVETAIVPEAQMAETEITVPVEVALTPSPVEAVPSTESAPVQVDAAAPVATQEVSEAKPAF